MLRLSFHLTLFAALAAGPLSAASPVEFFPLKDIRPGMKGVGKTIFSGLKVETFDVEILGVLENSGPKQSVILARLGGATVERTGVMQGMSGSPVYIDGKLVGAVALAFPFSKEPIAGIRPITEMVEASASVSDRPVQQRASLRDKSLVRTLASTPASPLDSRPVEIATPVSFSGFTASTLEHFGPQLRAIGLEPRQAISGGQSATPLPATPLEPGSMITVQLVSGDLSIGADGTLTHIDGNKIYAFGHRFMALGATEMPFARASVLALLPNLSTSFKISSSGESLGVVTSDLTPAISGELGKKPELVPVSITINGSGRTSRYQMSMVQDPLLSPLLLQMMLYSSLDATERLLGSGTISLRGKIELAGVAQPLVLDNMFAGDYNVPLQAALSTALPVAVALQNSLDPIRLKAVDLVLEAFPTKKQLNVEQVWTSRREVRPGEAVELKVLLSSDSGREVTHTLVYQVPVGAPPGTLYFTAADGATTNASEQRFIAVNQPAPAERVISFLNSLRGSNQGVVRVWRADPAYNIEGRDMPDPPASLSMLLARSSAAPSAQGRTSTIQNLEFTAGDTVISGSKTVQVEVKE